MANPTNYAIKAHCLTTSEKPSDRFLTCDFHLAGDDKQNYKGSLFSLVEILNPWPSIISIGKTITNTCFREYLRTTSSNVQDNLELALKKVNDTLAQYTQSGETEWIGNLHALLAIIYHQELHLASVGIPFALLLRDGKFINIIEEQVAGDNDTHPLHTFSNITSGELQIGDIIVFASTQLYDAIEKKRLRELLELHPLSEAAQELAAVIRYTQVNPNLILIEITTQEELTLTPPPKTPAVLLFDKINEPTINRLRSFYERRFSRRLVIVGSFAASILAGMILISKSSRPHLKKISSTLYASLSTTGRFLWQNLTRLLIRRHRPSSLDSISSEITSITEKPIHIHHYHRRPIFSYLLLPFRALAQIIPIIKYRFFRLTQHAHQRYRLWRIIGLFLILILLISLIFKINSLRSHPKTPSANINIASLEQKYDQTDQMATKDAVIALDAILATASSYHDDNLSLRSLVTKTERKLDSLTDTHRLNPSSSVNTPADAIAVYIFKNKYYFLTSAGQIYQSSPSSSPQLTAQLPSDDNQIVASALRSQDNQIFIFTAQKKLYQFSPQSKKITSPPKGFSASWRAANLISSYQNNLYFLNSSQSKLWKYAFSDDQYQSPLDYTRNESLLTDAKSLTIDGTIYVLTKKNNLLLINQGRSSTLNLGDYPLPRQKITNPFKILTDSTTDYLYILEPSRLIIFTKTGSYEKEYIFPNSTTIIDATLAENKIWLLTKDKLFSINID